MAKYDHGGGCPCGLYKECDPGCSEYAWNQRRRIGYRKEKPVTLELLPPPEHAHKLLHWVAPSDINGTPGYPTVALLWHGSESTEWSWQFLQGGMKSCSALDALTLGYRYLGPAEWRAPEPHSEATKSAGPMEYVSLSTQARLVEIAHGTTNAVIAEAAIRILAACAMPSEMPT